MKEMSTIRFAIWNMPKVAGQEFIFAKSEASKESSKSVDRFFFTLMVYESVPAGSWTGDTPAEVWHRLLHAHEHGRGAGREFRILGRQANGYAHRTGTRRAKTYLVKLSLRLLQTASMLRSRKWTL